MAIEQARFYNLQGLSSEEVGNALADWFRQQGFEWRTFGEPASRYTLQVRKANVFRSIFGLNYALTVTFTPQPEGKTLVELGGAEWTDKLVSGAIGMLLVAPLIFTAAYGAWQQSDLNSRVWDVIDGYVYNRTGQSANPILAVPYYNQRPSYNPTMPPPPGTYNPTTNYPPDVSGFPPPSVTPNASVGVSRPEGPQDRSWFDMTTMQPVFDQQIGRMASWQGAMADGKIVDEELKEQTEKVERLRQQVEETLSTEQRIKLAEVLGAMQKLETAHSSKAA